MNKPTDEIVRFNRNLIFGSGLGKFFIQEIKHMKKESILTKQFNSRYGINNWCLYNQEDQDRTSLIVRGESGFYNTTWTFSDDYVQEIHKENGISEDDVTEIICSSMFNLGSA
tara:strand:- start:942 stop:1280 length:339 start_codon:yes stop_codon:yes gene_type:complete